MANLAIIPARGGSKRIPKKNIKDFHGKPIIAYSIETALQSRLFDEVMVSTDSKEIAEISTQFGATVPFLRSNENANDFAVLADVIEEVVHQYKKQGKTFENVCCILPTAPLISIQKLNEAFQKLGSNFTAVIPVIVFSTPIQRALSIKNDVLTINEKYINTRSQDLEPHYFDAGQFYWLKTANFLSEKKVFTKNATYIELNENEAQDVDTPQDWKLLELKYKLWT